MADFGTGVSRTLDPTSRQFMSLVWQKGHPPLDAELNLMSQMDWDNLRKHVASTMPSGFILDPTRADGDFLTNPQWANMFKFGHPRAVTGVHESPESHPIIWANVNGWIIPVVGSQVTAEGDMTNVVKLYPPPASDSRIDFIFLEAWQTRVDPNPSILNKPSASTIWKFGNTLYGGTNLTDDIEDPTIGHETTGRIQTQYRIRVFGSGVGGGSSVALDVYPDGLDDSLVLGQGAATLPVAGYQYTNMRAELGDSSLWRAGDGNPNNGMGTVDGYTYAIPICAIFRRNRNVYVAAQAAGNPNQNGAFDRTPNSAYLPDPLTGARELTTAEVGEDLAPTLENNTFQVNNLNGSGFDDPQQVLGSVFMVIDDEIVGIEAVDLVTGTIKIPTGGRGRFGTSPVGHADGTPIRFFNSRPGEQFADEITHDDILDMRRGVNPGDWDYGRLLAHNVAALVQNTLRATWKKAAKGDTQGVTVHEVDYLSADGSTAVPNHTEALDGPDGIRTIFSDAATPQPEVSLLLRNDPTLNNGFVGFTTPLWNNNTYWDVAPDFKPSGFMNWAETADDYFCNGTVVLLHLGGQDGSEGARGTFRDGTTRAVRALMPYEYWKSSQPDAEQGEGSQNPWKLRFLKERSQEPGGPTLTGDEQARHPGPMYPARETNFERPFIVLGGVLRTGLKVSITASDLHTDGAGVSTIDVGLDFDAAGTFFSKDSSNNFENDPTAITMALLRNERTLYGMLTDNGRDRTGSSSEVYVVLYGDDTEPNNNGAFKVIGAGSTAGYTTKSGGGATSIQVVPLTPAPEWVDFDPATTKTITVEFRSQHHNAEDTSSYSAEAADIAVVLTDIGGEDPGHLWNKERLGDLTGYDLHIPYYAPGGGAPPTLRPATQSKCVIDMTLLYHPGRSGMARVADYLTRFAMKGGTTETVGAYLQQSGAAIDTTFASVSGVPTDESWWNPNHIQLWNRLPSLGLAAPYAAEYGGAVVGFTEQDREHELFVDRGSKTVLFRPFRDRQMTLQAQTDTALSPGCLLGSSYTYPTTAPKDGAELFTGTAGTGKQMGFPVPWEYMPRFGRQDIPNWQRIDGNDPFLPGINHLFVDTATLSGTGTNVAYNVFQVIGGQQSPASATEVTPMFLGTGVTAGGGYVPTTRYAQYAQIIDPRNATDMYSARKTTDIDPVVSGAEAVIADLAAVNSSDLGRGLRGIQLPPYLGLARVFGVYDARDYISKGGRTFKANRYEEESDPAPNLLRQDARDQTLFILQDGAQDLTGETGDHTYIIPENVLDLTRAVNWTAGDDFADDEYQFVVLCTVFGFAHGWINENNYVLVRMRGSTGLSIDGTTTQNSDGDDTLTGRSTELAGFHMVLPCAAGHNDQLYVAYNRTAYQGDVFMSRSGSVKTTSDYEHRYGQLSVGAQYALRTPIQQYDAEGDYVPERPNPKAFEVLASMDFYTTMGTGKIGGELFSGTQLDVGFTDNNPNAANRQPESADSNPWRVFPRAFTEGQKFNTSRASLLMEVLTNNDLNPGPDQYAVIQIGLLDGSSLDLWAAKAAWKAALLAFPYDVPATDIFDVDESSSHRTLALDLTVNFGAAVGLGEVVVAPPLAMADVAVGDAVVVNARLDYTGFDFKAYVNAPGSVTVIAMANQPDVPFQSFGNDAIQQIIVANTDWAPVTTNLAPGATAIAFVNVPGLAIGDVALVRNPDGFHATPGTDPIIYQSYCATSQLKISAHNTGPVPIDITGPYDLAFLKEQPQVTTNLSAVELDIRVIQTQGTISGSVDNLEALINDHELLQGTVKTLAQGNQLIFEAVPVGEEGNNITVSVRHTGEPNILVEETFLLLDLRNAVRTIGSRTTSSPLLGGVDKLVNGGDGTSQIDLTGMTERFPLGALVQDSDFLCENPLNDAASAVQSRPVGPRPVQSFMPLTRGGEEYTRFLGAPGDLVALSDGSVSVLSFSAWTTNTPTGSKVFRMFRGGGPVYVLSGDNPGGPVEWASDTFPPSVDPVLKGSVLVCRAMLVRNFYEEAKPGGGPYKVSDGDEIQMVVVTSGLGGNTRTSQDGLTLQGSCSPAGYGEGYAAADRYRLNGKPMFRGFTQQVADPAETTLAVYPDELREGRD